MAKRKRSRSRALPAPGKGWWWVRHGTFGKVMYGVSTKPFIPHQPKQKRKRHFGMSMPVALYPTTKHLPIHRELIPVWTDKELRNHIHKSTNPQR